MVVNAVKGISGTVLIVLLSVLLVFLLAGAVIFYRRTRVKQRKNALVHKYSIVTSDRSVLQTTRKPIQPPLVNVRLVPQPKRLRKQNIVYDESMDQQFSEDLLGKKNDTSKSINNKINEILKGSPAKLKRHSVPEFIALEEQLTVGTRRIPRPDSIYNVDGPGLGYLSYTFHYNLHEHLLALNLICGREIHSTDVNDEIKFPAVCIQVEGQDDSEVTSSPDDAPHPLYDQEFFFPLTPEQLEDSVLRFTVLDLVYSHEVRVVGFVRECLHNYPLHKQEVTPIISGKILMTLSEGNFFFGEIVVSLLYDCVTDKINIALTRLNNICVGSNDKEVYVKVSLLLDNKVISSKRTPRFPSSTEILMKETFEFSALSGDLNYENSNQDLIVRKSSAVVAQLSKTDSQSSGSTVDSLTLDALKNNMGVLVSVRATSTAGKKRVIGRLYLGRTTKVQMDEEERHWCEMWKNFDTNIAQCHYLKMDRI